MKTEWDYTDLADAYLKRPDYADKAIDRLLELTNVKRGSKVCDVGAGVGHLTLLLAKRGLSVTAVEPNDAMRANGSKRLSNYPDVTWFEGTGEKTGQPSGIFDLVTFGSSFNVCDRASAMAESVRILKPAGWFACMWNHRNLDDPIQSRIEEIIRKNISSYQYGTRREDQTALISGSGMFSEVTLIEEPVWHRQALADCVEAWRSHATLQRQASERFPQVVAEIERFLCDLGLQTLEIPYTTRIWAAQVRSH